MSITACGGFNNLHTLFIEALMFTLDGNLQFINIDTQYIKMLHDVCDEVFYRAYGYENKPYLGLLISYNGHNIVSASKLKMRY